MSCRIFLDLETTCLDPATGHILEIGVLATTAEAPAYTEVAAQSWVVNPGTFDLNGFTLDMHTKSGLLDDIRAGRGLLLADAERGLLDFLRYFGNPAPGREPIAGFSPHFDLAWLRVHLPRVASYFSHRTFDCSTLRQLARDLGRADLVPTADAAHRALADCRAAASMARAVAGLCAVPRD